MLSSSTLLQQQQPRHSRQNSMATTTSGSPQRQSTTLSPSFGRLSTQDFSNPQHSPMQRAQQHSAAQPGLSATLDNRVQTQIAHLQMIQMMQEQASLQGVAPPESAIQSIQNQIKSFYATHPEYMTVGMSPQSRPGSSPMPGPSPMAMPIGTPLMMPRAMTPPGTYLPTPPQTGKQSMGRVRHMDVSPMALNLHQVPMMQFQPPVMQDMPLFEPMGNEYAYSSPSYAGSIASAVSPHMSPLKNGFCEDSPMMAHPTMMMDAHAQAMMAAANGGYYYPESPARSPLSPREAMLASLAVDASIEDTGISAEEVSAYISPQDSEGKWTCLFPDCNKKFGRKENIRSHVQTHLGDRQFKCNHCGKCFVRQHDLKRHAKIHSGDKPHKCPCGNGFARQDALTRHRQRGVCSGTLPGFERREVKRGRPRKNRPELSSRADKASRARRRDAEDGSDDSEEYSSGSPSDSGSEPYTPAHQSDVEPELDLGTAAGVEAFIRAYSHSPSASDEDVSSPVRPEQVAFDFTKSSPTPDSAAAQQPEPSLGDSIFDWGGIASAQPSLVADGGSSPTATDLFGDELDLLDTRAEADSMFDKSVSSRFDFSDEWISLPQ